MLLLISVVGSIIYSQSWEVTNLTNTFVEPSLEYHLGTDQVGRDVLARVMYGGIISLSVGVVVVAIQGAIGTTLRVLW